jgi:hypothetical protein
MVEKKVEKKAGAGGGSSVPSGGFNPNGMPAGLTM